VWLTSRAILRSILKSGNVIRFGQYLKNYNLLIREHFNHQSDSNNYLAIADKTAQIAKDTTH